MTLLGLGYELRALLAMALTPSQIADRAIELRTSFLGISLALPALMHPEMPLLGFYRRIGMGDSPSTVPVEIYRKNGTLYEPTETIGSVLKRATEIPGAGMRGDALAFAMMHGAVTLGDGLLQARLILTTEPLLQFGRHFRNACAHGNRWHFRPGEPNHPARLRRRRLTPRLHGTRAAWGWVAPGDYLDYLDDLEAYLRPLR